MFNFNEISKFNKTIFEEVIREHQLKKQKSKKKSNHYHNYLHRLEQIKRIKSLRENPLNFLFSKISKKNVFLM